MKFQIARSVASYWSILLARLKKSTMQNAWPTRLLHVLLPPIPKPAAPSHGIRLPGCPGTVIHTRKGRRTSPFFLRSGPLRPRETGEFLSYQ